MRNYTRAVIYYAFLSIVVQTVANFVRTLSCCGLLRMPVPASGKRPQLGSVAKKEINTKSVLINIIIVPSLMSLHKTLSQAQGQRAHKPPQGYTLKQPPHPILITPKFNNDIVYNILSVLHNYSTYKKIN